MSQQQPQRPQSDQDQPEPIRYGDVFPTVQGDLAGQPIKPQDAAMMQSAENLVMGKTQKGGPASVMQSAATRNERAGLVGHDDVSKVPAEQGVTVSEADLPGHHVITETVAGQVVSQYAMPSPMATAGVTATGITGTTTGTTPPAIRMMTDKITIGEALEAAAMTAGDKVVEQSDAAAIQAAEIRATGINENVPGGVAAAAQSAADANIRTMGVEAKMTLGDVLSDATTKLPADKAVTARDAERVTAAELRNNPTMTTAPGGVAASPPWLYDRDVVHKGRENTYTFSVDGNTITLRPSKPPSFQRHKKTKPENLEKKCHCYHQHSPLVPPPDQPSPPSEAPK